MSLGGGEDGGVGEWEEKRKGKGQGRERQW